MPAILPSAEENSMAARRDIQTKIDDLETGEYAAAIRSAAAADYADKLLEIRSEQPLSQFERDTISAFDQRMMIEMIADLALRVPQSEIFPVDPDFANASCGLSGDIPEVDEVIGDCPMRSWIPNARTQPAIREARTMTHYNSARRHRLDTGG
jgi:hypothetical protein